MISNPVFLLQCQEREMEKKEANLSQTCREMDEILICYTGHNKHPLPTTQEKTIHGHHQMVNTKIRLIIFFAAKDGEALYSQQKQDQELTVA